MHAMPWPILAIFIRMLGLGMQLYNSVKSRGSTTAISDPTDGRLPIGPISQATGAQE